MADPAPDAVTPDLGYARLALDRCAERRHDPAFFEAERSSTAALAVMFAGDKAVYSRGVGGLMMQTMFPFARPPIFGVSVTRTIYLGQDTGAPRFACQLDVGAEELIDSQDDVFAGDLRSLAVSGMVVGQDLALLGYAKSLLAWHARNGFCSNCGTATEATGGGWRRDCPNCGAMHFPRVDPVVIMLVTHDDRCLLGRQPRFPPDMWSCLAGFVEPGETIEDACRREVKEEAGVTVGAVDYQLSQPWPFPSQLMLGVRAEALTEELTPDLDELDDARWFSREEAARLVTRTHPDGLFAPPPSAIAHHLLRTFAGL